MKEASEPRYDLEILKHRFDRVNKLNMTYTAIRGQYELGFNDQDVVNITQSLTEADFYKSMKPTHERFSAWQDINQHIKI